MSLCVKDSLVCFDFMNVTGSILQENVITAGKYNQLE